MTEEDVEALNRRLSQTGGETPETVNMSALPRKKRGGIALANVNTRVRLMFGDDYGLRVYSVPGIGTECCLTLPLRYEE